VLLSLCFRAVGQGGCGKNVFPPPPPPPTHPLLRSGHLKNGVARLAPQLFQFMARTEVVLIFVYIAPTTLVGANEWTSWVCVRVGVGPFTGRFEALHPHRHVKYKLCIVLKALAPKREREVVHRSEITQSVELFIAQRQRNDSSHTI